MSLDLTILLATRDRAEVLRRTLAAMCGVRREGLAVELVVVDNGSSDHTQEVLREFATRLPLRCLVEPRPGKCHALNRGLAEAALGDVVVFTDDDVTPEASWLEAIVSACERWPEYSVFGGRIDVGWPRGFTIPSWARQPGVQSMAFSAHHLSDCESEYPARREPFGPNYWVRRSALEGVRFNADIGPRPRRRTLGDETDLLRRLRARGASPLYSPLARVFHRVEIERAMPGAVLRRAIEYGRGAAHVDGVPEQQLLRRSRLLWRARIASNVGLGLLGVVAAGLDLQEEARFPRALGSAIHLAKNFEALRCAARVTPAGTIAPA